MTNDQTDVTEIEESKESPSEPIQGRNGEQQFVGTPLYTAPEMFNSQESSKALDIWALGVIIYQMHVGKTPFFGRSLGDIFLEV